MGAPRLFFEGAETKEAAPPFALFEGWEPRMLAPCFFVMDAVAI